jgi:hypothetical protein
MKKKRRMSRFVSRAAPSEMLLEMELAAAELKRKMIALAAGIGLALGAALLLVLALWYGVGAAAAGIATTLPVWAALLIVTGGLVLFALILGAFAYLAFKRGTPPVPEQAIREARLTTEALRSDGSH